MDIMRNLWQMWESQLTNHQIDNILYQAESLPFTDAVVGTGDSSARTDYRRSRVKWFDGNGDVRDILFHYISEANRLAFNVNVTNYAQIQYTEYLAENKGHYNWHHDVFWQGEEELQHMDRKLSIVVQLSDADCYEGGEFEFQEVQSPEASFKSKGSVLVFPSYLTHRVNPVTFGRRLSLVAWFYGPRWS